MSGIKDLSVTMTRAQRDNLINTARRAEQTALQARQRELAAQNALNAAGMRLETLNRSLNNEISGLHSEIRQLANEHNRRLIEQASNFNGAISDLKSQMEKNREDLQNAINNVSLKIEEKENNHRKLAEFWIGQSEAFFNDIGQYRHELFAPSQLQRLKDQLTQVSADMRNEAFQAAIASSRNVFNQAAELKDRVVNAEIEWNYYHTKFQQALADTKSNLNYRQTMQFVFTTENGDEAVDANIDYWTSGELEAAISQVAEIDRRLEKIGQIPTRELVELTDALKQINKQMELAEDKAKEAIVSSQLRAEMASALASSLAECGWICDGVTYEGEELSEPVHVKLSDGLGNEIVAVIAPDKKSQDLNSNLEINFFDPKNNDEEQRQVWIGSIQNGLNESGLGVGAPVCREGYEHSVSNNDAIRDIKATAVKQTEVLKSMEVKK